MNNPTSFTPHMIREAAERIRPLARRTPVMTSQSIDERAGVSIFLKCENFQRGGAFKIRGAANLILSLSPEERKRGIVAFSSGNHAQAVAIAARHVGTSATTVMCPVRPWVMELRRTVSLPLSVRGPVDFLAFARLAIRRFLEIRLVLGMEVSSG